MRLGPLRLAVLAPVPVLVPVLVLVAGLAVPGCSSDDEGTKGPGVTAGVPEGGTPGPDGGTTADSSAPPPVGDGIAAKYPGDVGIEADPDVIFADGFESYGSASDLSQKWDNFFQVAQTKIVTDPANVKAGAKALEFSLPQQGTELSNAVQKILTTELDVLYLRYYSKFDSSFDVSGSCHNGGGISAHYFQGNNATPGVPANGTNKFLIEYEHWRGEVAEKSPGAINVYVYHPEQRDNYGDHFFPTGLVMPNTSLPFDFGSTFQARADITPELDRWYAYEVMLRANTPGQRDGRITLWLDGQVVADFPNLRLRDVGTLKIDRFNLSLHAGSNTSRATRKWYDSVVAARAYIGPIYVK
jgi:hypothetical protein